MNYSSASTTLATPAIEMQQEFAAVIQKELATVSPPVMLVCLCAFDQVNTSLTTRETAPFWVLTQVLVLVQTILLLEPGW